MRAKFIYLMAVLVAYLLTSCRTSKTVERVDAKRITTGRMVTNVVSLDSLQRWLSGRLLVTEVHLFQPDSTGAQAVEKVVTKELTFAGGEEQAQEVKAETVVQVDELEEMTADISKESTRKKSPLFAWAGLAVCVALLIFVQLKQLNTK